MRQFRLQKALVVAHRYVGLVLGPVVAILGLTGAALVVFYTIDRTLNPALFDVAPVERTVSMSDLMARGRDAVPQLVGPTRVQMPADLPYVLTFTDSTGDAFVEVMMNPADGAVLGVRDASDAFVWQLFTLHAELFAGAAGPWLVGAVGVATVALGMTGIYLWWPRAGGWRRALRVRRGERVRFLYDLHRVSGLFVSVVLIELGASGVALTFPEAFTALLGGEPKERRPALVATQTACAGPASPDDAVRLALERFPLARATALYPPRAPGENFAVGLRQPAELGYTYGATRVEIDAECSQVMSVFDPLNAPLAERVTSWLLPLHSGQFFGAAGRALTLCAGLALGLLLYTGFVTWLDRRRARQRALSRAGGVRA